MQHHDRQRDTRRSSGALGYVEDFTVPFLVTAGVLCFVLFYAVLGVFGWFVTLGLAYGTDKYMARRQRARARVSRDG
ncbi:hypothetical protein AIOL_003368 [Candidatus Rhodobacter oscarellae]|uniref:Uncharacterized protein n=1 Tax=Candidatus Rhodobacter oscarellae TaxID=1675527 RepID=A0A0J9E6J8_9RHOB|nr:hypothetical protein [Candidatus Rhodobacter lobularis]KMW58395.1 hypothetical protein AIOL_003368 [Candidatus Rhodobacter lobularis]